MYWVKGIAVYRPLLKGLGVGEGKCPIILLLGLSVLVSVCCWAENFTSASVFCFVFHPLK